MGDRLEQDLILNDKFSDTLARLKRALWDQQKAIDKAGQTWEKIAAAKQKADDKAAAASAKAMAREKATADKMTQIIGRAQSAAIQYDKKLDDRKAATAAKALARIEKQAARQAELHKKETSYAKEAEAAERKLHKLMSDPSGYKKMLKAQHELSEHQKKMKKQVGDEGFFKGLKVGLFGWAQPYGGGRIASAAAGELLAEGIKKGFEIGIDLLKDGFKEAFAGGMKRENNRLAYTQMLGKGGANEALEAAEKMSKGTKYSDDEILQSMKPLIQAGMTIKTASSAFAAAGDLSVMTGDSIEEFVAGFAKMQRKGGMNEKMVDSLKMVSKDFFGDLGKAIGVKPDEAKKLAKEGKIPVETLKNAVYRAIEKKQGGQLGSSVKAEGGTMQSRFKKIGELPEEYLKQIEGSPAWTKLEAKLGEVMERLDPSSPTGQRIVGRLMDTFGKVVGWVDRMLQPDKVDKFAGKVEWLVSNLDKIPAIADKVVTVAEVLGTIWAGEKIASGFAMLTSGITALTPIVAAVSAPVWAVVAAFTAWAVAIDRIAKTVKELGGIKRVWGDFKEWASGDGPALATDKVNANSPQWKVDRARRQQNISAPMSVTVNGAGDPEAVADSLASRWSGNVTNTMELASYE